MLDYILLGGFIGIFMCVIILIMFSNGFIGIVIRTSILVIIFLWLNKIIKNCDNFSTNKSKKVQMSQFSSFLLLILKELYYEQL